MKFHSDFWPQIFEFSESVIFNSPKFFFPEILDSPKNLISKKFRFLEIFGSPKFTISRNFRFPQIIELSKIQFLRSFYHFLIECLT